MTTTNNTKRCYNQVRDEMTPEMFRLPTDGRQSKHLCRARKFLFENIVSNANGDGTFIRNGIDYSPTITTIVKRTGYSKKTVLALLDDLNEMAFLTWTFTTMQPSPKVETHYLRHSYTAHLPMWDNPDENRVQSSENVVQSSPNRVQSSNEPGAVFEGKTANVVQSSSNVVQSLNGQKVSNPEESDGCGENRLPTVYPSLRTDKYSPSVSPSGDDDMIDRLTDFFLQNTAGRVLNMAKNQRPEYIKLAKKYGEETLQEALKLYVEDSDFDRIGNPSSCFLARAVQWIQKAKFGNTAVA